MIEFKWTTLIWLIDNLFICFLINVLDTLNFKLASSLQEILYFWVEELAYNECLCIGYIVWIIPLHTSLIIDLFTAKYTLNISQPWYSIRALIPILLTYHSGFLEHWNSQKSVCNIWQHFSSLLDEGIPKIWKKLNSLGGFLRAD